MRVEVLSRHLPQAQGTAAGRVLLATAEGLLGLGHEVAVTSWCPDEPSEALPSWCTTRRLPAESAWRTRARALVRPRSDVELLGWEPRGLAVADDPVSAAALPPRGIGTLHYATAIDVRHLAPRDLQDLRAERRLRRSGRVLAYSPRVARWVAGQAIPAAIRIPPSALEAVEQPVAALVADWTWPPNQRALESLLTAWRGVSVPGARLLLAGRGGSPVSASGVEWLGPVTDVNEVLSQAAVLAFPCPDTSGPKVKVLEAAAGGLPVITTPAGAEGIGSDQLQVTSVDGFAAALDAVLRDPSGRAARAARVRSDVIAVHGPLPAARARLEAIARLQE